MDHETAPSRENQRFKKRHYGQDEREERTYTILYLLLILSIF